MQTNTTAHKDVPADFPREEVLGSIGGTQPKLLLKKSANGTYGPVQSSEAEVRARFEMAADIVGQLHNYFVRKQSENSEWTVEHNIDRIRRGLANKVNEGLWPFTAAEQAWIMNRLRKLCN